MLVFDVSAYNTGDLPPCDGLIARTTTKDGKIDHLFEYWYNHARYHNLPFGAYKYTYATSSVFAEVESISVAKLLQGVKLSLGFWLDCETSELRNGSDSVLKSIIEEYKETMNLFKIPWGGIYCDANFYYHHEDVLVNEKIWLARWTNGINAKPIMYNNPNVVGWQYTNKYNGKNLDASLWKTPEKEQAQDENKVLYNPDNVRLLQEYLNKHYGYQLKVDGVMGTKTFTAICQSLAK